MPTLSPPSLRCTACGAPNPAGRTGCWSCAEPLLAAPSGASSAPGDSMRACPTCGTVSAVYHRLCPGCGQALNAACAGLLHSEPSGWHIHPLPDGSVQLCRTRQSRTGRIAGVILALLVVAWIAWTWLGPARIGTLSNSSDNAVMVWVHAILVLCALVLLGWTLLWQLYGVEEWRVANNSLTIRRELFGRSREWRCSDATLEVRSWWSRHGRITTLSALTGRGRAALGSEWWSRHHTETLARYLSVLTGWPVSDLGTVPW